MRTEMSAWAPAVLADVREHFKDGNTCIKDEPRSGRPRTASTECNKERVDDLIRRDRRVIVNYIAAKRAVEHSAVQEMIQSLGCRKVCVRWFPRLLTENHRFQRRTIWVGNSSTFSVQPGLTSSGYRIFGSVKEQMRGQWYEALEDPQQAVRQCLWATRTDFYRKGIFKLAEK